MSGGPYIGPRGGKWADPEHTVPWKEEAAPGSGGEPEPLGFDARALAAGEVKPGKATFAEVLGILGGPAGESKRKHAEEWLRSNWGTLGSATDEASLGAALDGFDSHVYDRTQAEEKAQKEAVARGRLEAVQASQAHRRSGHPGPVSTPSQGQAWAAGGAMPDPIYHATLAGSGIMATGLKAREDFRKKGERVESLGGGPEDTVSTTPHQASAHKIAAVFAALAEAQTNPQAVKAWLDEHWVPLIPESYGWARREIEAADKHENPMVGVKKRFNLVSQVAGYENPNVLVPAIMALPKPGDLKDIGVVTAYAHVDAVVDDKGRIARGPGSEVKHAESPTVRVTRPDAEGNVKAQGGASLHREHAHLETAHVANASDNKAEQGEIRVAPEDVTAVHFEPVGDWRVLLSPSGMAKSMDIGEVMGPALDRSGYKGVLNFHGLLLGIEHATGDINPWSKRKTKASYGEFPATLGNDGDPVDFLLGHDWDTDTVYVLQQRVPNGQNEQDHSDGNGGPGQYDEDKVVLGASSEADARELFEDYYQGSGREVSGVLVFTIAELVERLGAPELRGFGLFKGLDGVDPVTGGPIVAQFFDDLDRLAKSASPPPGYHAIPGGKKGGYRKKTARGYDYWYPDQHHEGQHPDWEAIPGQTGTGGMEPGHFALVLGHGSKLYRWTPEHEGDLPAGQTWMTSMETGEHVAVQASKVQPVRGAAKASGAGFGGKKKAPPKRVPQAPKRKPSGDNLPPPPRLPPPAAGPTSEVPSPSSPRVPVFAESSAKKGTVLHNIENGAYGVLRYRDAAGRTQVGMYVPQADQTKFLTEMRGLTHAAVSHVARNHRIRERGAGGGLSPEYQDLYSAAQLGLVQAGRSYNGKVNFRAHAYRYMKTYSAMEARDSLGRGVPVPSRIRRLTEGYLASVNRAQVMFGVETPTDEMVARAWNVTKKHVYQRDLGRYVRTGKKGPESVDQASEQLPMEDWQVRTPTGEASGKLFPGKLNLVEELRKFTAGDRTEGSEWMEDMQVASVLPRHAAATMPMGTALHLRQEVDGVLADMEPAQAQALTLRWGLDGGEPMELTELAEAMKLTGEGASKKAGISAAEKLVNKAKAAFKTIAHSRQAEVARYIESWSGSNPTERVKVEPPMPGAKSYADLAAAFKGDNDEAGVADERVRIYTALAAEGGGSAAEVALRREASGEATPAEVDALRERYYVARDKQRLRAFHLQTRTVPVDPGLVRNQNEGSDPNGVALYADEVLHGYMRAVARRGMPGFAPAEPSPGEPGPSRVWSDERLASFLGVPVDRITQRAGGAAPPSEG